MSLKHKLQNNALCLGSWITLAHPAIAEIMCNAGFSWLAVDLEHSVISINEAAELIRSISLKDVSPLVRLTSNNRDQIKRVMDAGSHGVIVPMVNSRQEAIDAIEAVYYPPKGKRGVGLARAQQYGAGFADYMSWMSNEPVIVAQIEHVDAVEQIDQILSLPEIDAYIIGPYDLSASLNIHGDFSNPRMLEAMSHVKTSATKHNKAGGIHIVEPKVEELKERIDEGYRFLAYSVDIRMLDVMSRTAVTSTKELI